MNCMKITYIFYRCTINFKDILKNPELYEYTFKMIELS